MASYAQLKTRQRAQYPFIQDYRTRWIDNDMYAHLNNSIYHHLFDSIVNSYLIQECGLDPAQASSTATATSTITPAATAATTSLSGQPKQQTDVQGDQIGLVVSSHCSYFAPVSFPSVLDVGLRIKKLGKSSVEYETAVFEQGSEDVKAVGGFTHVFVDRSSRKIDSKNGMSIRLRDGLTRLERGQAKL